MDFANSLLQLANNLWGLAGRPLGYICNLKDDVHLLQDETGKLKAKSKDVLAKVEREERGGAVHRTEEVAYWLDTVEKFVGRADQIRREAEERDQIKCLNRCLPPNCWSSYKLGKRVDQMLNKVREIQPKEGEFDVVTSPSPPPLVLEMPMDETVGLDTPNLNELWKWVMDEKEVGMIGLYGIGGVGKTTLMRRIEKKLSGTNRFDVVIWAVVSRPVSKDKIQDTIRRRLDIKDESWEGWPQDERVHHLCQALTRKKFVLLLDDLWERLELSEIGVPLPRPQDRSKVVFTTRQEEVCHQMGANETFKVPWLMPEEALRLFENKVGKLTIHSHPQIPELAKEVAQECKGLPLALVTIGRAMAGRNDPRDWKRALRKLRYNPQELSGVEAMYHRLAFSYDSLNNPTLQQCFLYCCLFPEDYLIRTDNLIELWIGGGLLGDTDDVYDVKDEGANVLASLKMACLLESAGDVYERQCVKMHDVIRDMATWITHDHGQNKNKLLVMENEEDMSAGLISKWGEAKKVSLWGEQIRHILETPSTCSHLETLFVRETNVKLVPRGFFDSACLTTLNMSDNQYIQLFPIEICNLICLRYLNLSITRIRELPREIKNLTRLRWLLLDNTSEHFLIPVGAIASLPLNVFSQWTSFEKPYQLDMIGNDIRAKSGQVNEEEIIEELERMQHLADLSINVFKTSSALKIFQSPNLRKRIRRVLITNWQEDLTCITISYSPTGSGVFSHLEELELFRCTVLREMEITQGIGRAPNCACFPSLVRVDVEDCRLLDLSWLVHAPKLRELSVVDCESMEKIIGDGSAAKELAASGLFSFLESLVIDRLPNLTSIYDQALPFPRLERLHIDGCPRLRNLPLDSNSARGSLKYLRVSRGWWDKLEWEDDAARAIFTGKVTSFYK